MRFLDLTLATLAENLALDEALLLEAEGGGEVLRVWEWTQPAVVLGAGCHLAENIEEKTHLSNAVQIARRSSGGGTVLLGRGCLCYGLVLGYTRASELAEIQPSYAYVLGLVRNALSDLSPDIHRAGTSDLAAGDRKFSGNAQQRKRHHLLHHGTILYDFDLALVSRYLRLPSRQPDYRRQREHADFLMNVPAKASELKRRLRSAWQADSSLTTWPEELVRKLVAEKYSREDWIRRR
jgi:lipoate-protein ligase A